MIRLALAAVVASLGVALQKPLSSGGSGLPSLVFDESGDWPLRPAPEALPGLSQSVNATRHSRHSVYATIPFGFSLLETGASVKKQLLFPDEKGDEAVGDAPAGEGQLHLRGSYAAYGGPTDDATRSSDGLVATAAADGEVAAAVAADDDTDVDQFQASGGAVPDVNGWWASFVDTHDGSNSEKKASLDRAARKVVLENLPPCKEGCEVECFRLGEVPNDRTMCRWWGSYEKVYNQNCGMKC